MPAQPTSDLSTHKIYSGGNELPGTFQVVSIVVDRSINRIPLARIVLKDGDPASGNFPASNSPEFEPGKEVKIEAGFHSQNETIFEGVIIKHQIRLKNGRDSFLVIECKDKAYKMTLARKSKYFIDVKDSDIVESMLGNYGLQKDVGATTTEHKQIVQYNATDWDFMVGRMEVNTRVVLVENGKVITKKPAVETSATVSTAFGTDVLAFDAQLDATHQYETVTCKSWDLSSQEVAESDNESTGLAEAGDLSSSALSGKVNEGAIVYMHSGKLGQEELKSWATAVQTKNILSKARGVITCKGKFEAKPTGTLALTGFGDHLNGNHFISGVRHELKNNLWETTIQFGWWPEMFSAMYPVDHPAASGIVPAVHGLQIGIVTQLEGDPESEFRVQVKFPVMDNEAEGIWARVALLDAGNERGSFFMPEISDEVVVGFVNNDPRHAIILGMVNSSSKPAPITPADDNHEKGFVTRSKMKFLFNDDKKSILLQTPGGNEITLDEDQQKIIIKDENNNKIEMSSDGIIMESCKDIILKATGDMKAEGVNVEMKGSGNFKAEGSGGAKLSSSGTTDVKGSLVNIN